MSEIVLEAMYDWIIENCRVIDGGSSSSPINCHIGIKDNQIRIISKSTKDIPFKNKFNAKGNILCPGLIDSHTHDDLAVLADPDMISKVSQGVTTVVVGNCGISGSPAQLNHSQVPDPMNLLGQPGEFQFKSLSAYKTKIDQNKPALNVAALIGHTTLRNNHLTDLSKAASKSQLNAMQKDLEKAMSSGALGLSSGLAYANAKNSTPSEIENLLNIVNRYNGVYTTHLRNEFSMVIDAMKEAISSSSKAHVPLVISHHKVAGPENWGQSTETLKLLDSHKERIEVSCDCYPYSASSSTLDLSQVTEKIKIKITWSDPHPECAGKTLEEVAKQWNKSQLDTAKELQPAGAIYYNMHFNDVQQILCWDRCMIGSDGLPCDPNPHPRLYGSFSKVLGPLVRNQSLFSLTTAIYKMTGLPASVFPLGKRGRIKEGYAADLLLFDPKQINDRGTFENPRQLSSGILGVWVNGELTYKEDTGILARNGQFLDRTTL